MAQSTEGTDKLSEDAGRDKRSKQGEILRARLAVQPHPESSCAIVEDVRNASEVTHHLKMNRSREGPRGGQNTHECHTEIVFSEGGEQSQEYHTSPVNSKCICPVFNEYDCIPRIKAVKEESIIVVVSLPTRSELRELLAGLRQVCATVTIDWLVRGNKSDTTTEIDISTITPKQRQALELALEAGYYETPRRADLGELAARLDISKSAVSQRINAAETKLVKAFLDNSGVTDEPDSR